MRIERSVTIAAPADRVWGLVADLEREPELWKGTKAVRTLSSDGSTVEREVTLAFRDRVQRERVTLTPTSRILHEIVGGPMRGTKSVDLVPDGPERTTLRTVWDVRLVGLLKLGSRPVSKHVGEGTAHALERIKEVAEGRSPPA